MRMREVTDALSWKTRPSVPIAKFTVISLIKET